MIFFNNEATKKKGLVTRTKVFLGKNGYLSSHYKEFEVAIFRQ
jgi:hypothetical protein